MTYFLGRGVEYYDVPTVDEIAGKLDQDNGRFSTLLLGILESAPFQQRRTTPNNFKPGPEGGYRSRRIQRHCTKAMNIRKSPSNDPLALNRRRFLRNLGVCLAVPALEAFPRRVFAADGAAKLAATTATGVPLRTAFLYFPNGAIPSAWWPTGSEGAEFALNRTMEPLAEA